MLSYVIPNTATFECSSFFLSALANQAKFLGRHQKYSLRVRCHPTEAERDRLGNCNTLGSAIDEGVPPSRNICANPKRDGGPNSHSPK
jgi:hypothetical protein